MFILGVQRWQYFQHCVHLEIKCFFFILCVWEMCFISSYSPFHLTLFPAIQSPLLCSLFCHCPSRVTPSCVLLFICPFSSSDHNLLLFPVLSWVALYFMLIFFFSPISPPVILITLSPTPAPSQRAGIGSPFSTPYLLQAQLTSPYVTLNMHPSL